MMKKRLFEIIEIAPEGDRGSQAYDVAMMCIIIISMIPLAFKVQTPVLRLIDYIAVAAFIVDYILRWFTADYKFPRAGKAAYLLYPVSPFAVVDLLAILPSVTAVGTGFRLLKLLRLLRTLRVLRVLKVVRYSKNISRIFQVLRKENVALLSVGTFAFAYILVSALVVFNVEPESFATFFEAVYWATVSLTTVGYGDVYPVTTTGRIVTMISSLLGIAIVALPAGIITAGYMQELTEESLPAKRDCEEN
jgi:voltage-gated potassium channel